MPCSECVCVYEPIYVCMSQCASLFVHVWKKECLLNHGSGVSIYNNAFGHCFLPTVFS